MKKNHGEIEREIFHRHFCLLVPFDPPMEHTFTREPFPCEPTETSWKDNANWKEEYEKEWKGDPKLQLPPRTANFHFEHVPEFEDPDMDWDSHLGSFTADSRPASHKFPYF